MGDSKVHQPNDRLIKYTYGRKESAIGLLEGYLPRKVVAGIDWQELEVAPGSFVDPGLSSLHTDLLYRAKFKGAPIYMYCLFEHQSTPDPWIGLRLLGYKSAIWRELTKGQPKPTKLPPIYVLVVYNGRERWAAPLRWVESLVWPPDAAPEFLEMEVNFGYQLLDLSHLSAHEIRGDVAGRLTLSLMKAALEDRVLEWLTEAAPMLKLLRGKEVTGMFEALLRYLLAVDTSVSRENVFAALERSNTPELTRQAMSIADQLIAEGMEKGIEKGLEKGLEKGRKEGLEKGRLEGTIRLLQDLLGLPQSTDAELDPKSDLELQHLANELRARLAKA